MATYGKIWQAPKSWKRLRVLLEAHLKMFRVRGFVLLSPWTRRIRAKARWLSNQKECLASNYSLWNTWDVETLYIHVSHVFMSQHSQSAGISTCKENQLLPLLLLMLLMSFAWNPNPLRIGAFCNETQHKSDLKALEEAGNLSNLV